jgi:hypothetical protein
LLGPNDTKYGLAAAAIVNDMLKALDLSMRLESGLVHVNDTTPMKSDLKQVSDDRGILNFNSHHRSWMVLPAMARIGLSPPPSWAPT